MTTYATPQTIPATGETGLVNGDATSQNTVRGAEFVNRIQGNTLVDGNMYVNGTLAYTSTASATTSVTNGQSVLEETATTAGQVSVVNRGEAAPHATVNANGVITMTTEAAGESTASLTLTNGIGNTHGVVVTERQTVLSGGTHSTSLTLGDDAATFTNIESGGPTRVTGIADGRSDFDAVNFRQLEKLESKMSRGIASATALASIPQVEGGGKYSLGLGTGLYNGESSIAIGGSVRMTENAVFKGGFSFGSGGRPTGGAGVAFSW